MVTDKQFSCTEFHNIITSIVWQNKTIPTQGANEIHFHR